MRAWPLVVLCALAGCGAPTRDEAPSTEQIEQIATPHNQVEDVGAAVRLEPLAATDIGPNGDRSGCAFIRENRILFFATRTDAIARVGGELRHFVQTARAGPTGGFFEDRHVSISVGRSDEGDRLTVTNRRADAQSEWGGAWRCREGRE